jgi:hypothetical protein
LAAKSVSRSRFTMPAFDEGLSYGPLAGAEDPDAVFFQLFRMKQTIDRLASDPDSPTVHVLLVYYHGREALRPRGHFLRTSPPDLDPDLARYRIACEDLEKHLAGVLGGKLLLLDVQRDPAAADTADQVAHWPAGSDVAVMRFAEVGAAGSRAPLLTAWKEALARGSKLRDLARDIEESARRRDGALRKQNGRLLYHIIIPRSLLDLVIGRKG